MRSSFFCLFLFFFISAASSASQWDKFLNLTGCRLGDTNPVIPDLKKYLLHFGYFSNEQKNPSLSTDSFDKYLLFALRTYQKNFNLKVTGVLDTRTIYQLMTPRCGVPDIINGTTSMLSGKLSGGLRYSFFPGNPVWPPSRRTLTWAIVSPYSRLNAYILRETFRHALRRWEGVSDFRFFQVCPCESPDITIGFQSGDNGDGFPFDGPLGTFARAFPPTNGGFRLDADEDWTDDLERANSLYAFDLESVAVHEIGHLLGLGHSSIPDSIMYPTLRPMTRRVEMSLDEKLGIRTLYDEYGYGPEEEKDEPKLHVAN